MMLDTLSTPWKKYVSDRVYISLELELISSIVPGQSYSLPIEAVTQNRVRIQPDRAQPIYHTRMARKLTLNSRGLWL